MRTRHWTLGTLSLAAVLALGAYAVMARPAQAEKAKETLTGTVTLPQNGDVTPAADRSDPCGGEAASSTDITAALLQPEAGRCSHRCENVAQCPSRVPIGCFYECVHRCCVLNCG
jgi:hypothetical protein